MHSRQSLSVKIDGVTSLMECPVTSYFDAKMDENMH